MDRKIKILRIINRFNLGGPTYNATFLTRFMSDEYETLLIGGVHDEDEADSLHILEEYGVKPIIIPEIKREINFKNDRIALKKIKQIIREFQPDIVHTHASKAGFLGRYAAIQLNVPVVLHTFHGHVFHSYFGKIKTQVFKQIERYLARRTSGIIAISPIQKEELANEFHIASKDKIAVIPLGFDLERFAKHDESIRREIRAKYNIQENEVAIAIVGRLAPIKDHGYFLDVIEAMLQSTHTPCRIFIVGDGSEKAMIKHRVEKINQQYPNVITMTSWIYDIASFNQGVDIMCLTSLNEGTPVSVIEAQAAGIPVITTDVGGVRDILDDGASGFVIKRENIETYIDKLRLLVDNSDMRKEFALYGQQKVLMNFGYKRLISDMDKLYKSLLKK
ncbi:MAG: glycosyltransferase [Brumimicrobium sp.]|nr:glycosyltransferase [Brumimicrobium sp.]